MIDFIEYLQKNYPALYSIIDILASSDEVSFYSARPTKNIQIAISSLPEYFIYTEYEVPKNKLIKKYNIQIKRDIDVSCSKALEPLRKYAVAIGLDRDDNIIYILVKKIFPKQYIMFIAPINIFKEYHPDLEKDLVDLLLQYFGKEIVRNIIDDNKYQIVLNVTMNNIEIDDRIMYLYRNLFINKLKEIVNKYNEKMKEIQKISFKTALKILQNNKIVKVLPNCVDVSININPKYIRYKNEIYSFDGSKYSYKYVRIRLYTDEEMNVYQAKVVWWDENKRGKLVHPQISIYDKDVCLGELKNKDIYYVVENLENMLSIWNIDSPYSDTMEYLYKEYNINDVEDKKDALFKLLVKNGSKGNIWVSDTATWS